MGEGKVDRGIGHVWAIFGRAMSTLIIRADRSIRQSPARCYELAASLFVALHGTS